MAGKQRRNLQILPAKGDPASSDPSPESAELLDKFAKSLDLKEDRVRQNHGCDENENAETVMNPTYGAGRSVQSGQREMSFRNGGVGGTSNNVGYATGCNHLYPTRTQSSKPQDKQDKQYTASQQPLTQQNYVVNPTSDLLPYWPYDAQSFPYNGINYLTPQMSLATHWQYPQPLQSQAPFPQPTSSGTLDLSPPSKDPPEVVNPLAHIPEPTQDYLLTTSIPPHRLETPNTKLLILDLNGTLLYRRRHPDKDRNQDMRQSSKKPLLRPHLAEFINYIFRHFKIMFWSSATLRNVHAMISAVTTESQRSQILTIWDRSSLGLSPSAYRKKSVTFKDLNKIFTDKTLREHVKGGWDVSNTILLDDSVIKASNQPYNHVCVPEFFVDREHWEKEAEGVGGWKDDVL